MAQYPINPAIVQDYVTATLESSFLSETNIISGTGVTSPWGGNTVILRGYGRTPSLMSAPTVTTGTDVATYSQIAPVRRGIINIKSNDFDQAAGGITVDNVNQAIGIKLANDVVYNVEYELFTNILPGAFAGSLSSTHLVSESVAFSLSAVMKAQSAFGRPFGLKYLVVHPDIAGRSAIYDNRDAIAQLNSTEPLKVLQSSQFVGYINGIAVLSSPLCTKSGTSNYDYSSYLFGERSVMLDYQTDMGIEQFRAGNESNTYYIARPMFAMGPVGVSMIGSAGTATEGVPAATLTSGASWSRITSLNDWDINAICLKTK